MDGNDIQTLSSVEMQGRKAVWGLKVKRVWGFVKLAFYDSTFLALS
jgi:hypothetical protein